jgi:putative transposase
MGLVVDTSLTAVCVTRELDYIVEVWGCPRMIVSGNGTGTSNTILAWQDEFGISGTTSHPACRMGLSKAP